MRDAVEYGLSGIESGAAVVRTQVVVPLNDVVKGRDEQGRKAGAQAKSSLPSIVGGMEDVFPDVDRALNDLLSVLGKSLESSDDPAIFASLGDIYECGRRLMDACGRVTANPLDQLQIAAQKKLQGLGAGVEDLIKGLDRLDVEAPVKPLNSSLTSAETALRVSGGAFDFVVAGAAGAQIDPTQVQLADLSQTVQDPLLAKVRAQLRKAHGFPRDPRRKFGIEAVYSCEPLRLPVVSCETDAGRGPQGLACAGYGSSMAMTASVGLFASAGVLEHLLKESS